MTRDLLSGDLKTLAALLLLSHLLGRDEKIMSAYTDAVKRNLKGLEAVSVGNCPGCDACNGADEEPSFSWASCGICNSHLGGNRESWHAILDGKIVHWDDACVDCVLYIANGDEPESWEG